MLSVKVGPTFRDTLREFRPVLDEWHDIVDRVADLVIRIRTTKQSELASTVHFVATELAGKSGRRPSEAQVLEEVLGWKQRRKPPLEVHEIALATRNLAILRWLKLEPSSELPITDDPLLDLDEAPSSAQSS